MTDTISTDTISRERALTDAIDDAMLMLSYSTHCGVPIDEEVVAKIVDAARAETAVNVTAEQEAQFWVAAAAVAKARLPVTPESLRCSVHIGGRTSRATKAVWVCSGITLLMLILLLTFQVYWIVGTMLLADIDAVTERLNSMSDQYEHLTEAEQSLNKKAASYQIELDKSKRVIAAFDWKPNPDILAFQSDLSVLRHWNTCNPLVLFTKAGSATNTKLGPRQQVQPVGGAIGDTEPRWYSWVFDGPAVEQIQAARIGSAILLKYALPILYGALGACVFIVRSLGSEIRAKTYTSQFDVGYVLRFFLGMVAGLAIAWFTSDTRVAKDASGALQSLSPLALAFLAGFSVELLFSILERVVGAFSVPPEAPAAGEAGRT